MGAFVLRISVLILLLLTPLWVCWLRVKERAVVMAGDHRGWTALTFAVVTGRTEVVDEIVALIERKIPAEKVGGVTAIHRFCVTAVILS